MAWDGRHPLPRRPPPRHRHRRRPALVTATVGNGRRARRCEPGGDRNPGARPVVRGRPRRAVEGRRLLRQPRVVGRRLDLEQHLAAVRIAGAERAESDANQTLELSGPLATLDVTGPLQLSASLLYEGAGYESTYAATRDRHRRGLRSGLRRPLDVRRGDVAPLKRPRTRRDAPGPEQSVTLRMSLGRSTIVRSPFERLRWPSS